MEPGFFPQERVKFSERAMREILSRVSKRSSSELVATLIFVSRFKFLDREGNEKAEHDQYVFVSYREEDIPAGCLFCIEGSRFAFHDGRWPPSEEIFLDFDDKFFAASR